MSEIETPITTDEPIAGESEQNGTPSESDAPNAPTTEDASIESILAGGIQDDSRVEDATGFAVEANRLEDLYRNLRRTASTMRGQAQAAAREALSLAAMVMRPNGFPDWGRSTDAYKKTHALIWARVWATADDDLKRSTDQNVRQAVNRMRPAFIAEYVIRNEPAFADLRTAAERSDADMAAILANPSDALKSRVLEHIRQQTNEKGERLLKDPKDGPFKPITTDGETGGSGGGASGGPGRGGSQTATEIVRNAGQIVGQISAPFGAAFVATSLLALVAKVKTPEIENRESVSALLSDVNRISFALMRFTDGRWKGEEDDTALAEMVTTAAEHLAAVK